MSEDDSIHIHDSEGRDVGFICRGTGRYYIARTRRFGHQKYNVVSKHQTKKAAIGAMAKAFANGDYKRADVLLCADYYDPVMVCELVAQ